MTTGADQADVALAKQRWIAVVDSPFLPARGGGEQEHLGLLRAAARAGILSLIVMPAPMDVDLDPYRQAVGGVPILPTPRRRSPLLLLHPRDPFVVASRPAPRWITGCARELAPGATAVVTTSYKSWRVGARLARDLRLPVVLRHQNREGEYHRSLADGLTGAQRWVMRWEAARIRRDEHRLGRADWLRGTADISAADAEARRAAGGRNVVHVPPFAYDPRAGGAVQRRPDSEPRVVFLGALDVATNTTALDWLLTQVWPLVRAGAPSAILDVVGRRPSAGLRQRLDSSPGVRLHADVLDIAPFLARSAVAVNPAVSGSGVNIKVIDYLQAGVPLVSTSLATRGLALTAGTDLEVSDEPAGFAAAVLRLLRDRAAAEALGCSGQAHVAELLDPAANLLRIARLLGPAE